MTGPDGRFLPKPPGVPDWVICDDADREIIGRHHWHLHQGYPTTNIKDASGKRSTLRLHKLLMQPPVGFEVDHLNRNKCDVRRANLRVVTHMQNLHNNPARPASKTKVRGVQPYKRGGFLAKFCYNGGSVYLGIFPTLEAAAAEVRAFKLAYGVWPL